MNITLNQPLSFYRVGGRDRQEDARFPDQDVPSLDSRVFIVCDGVGGSSHGEVASRIVAQTFGEAIGENDLSQGFSNEQFSEVLARGYDALEQMAQDKEYAEMSTTFTMAVFHGDGVTLAHMGDSRIYHVRPSQGIIYRSEDHSLVNTWVRSGAITTEEASVHPQRHIITRCMAPVLEDGHRLLASILSTNDVEAGDYIFLCTDGVLEGINDDALTDILCDMDLSDEQKFSMIAEACFDSSDNNTAILIPVKTVEGNENTNTNIDYEDGTTDVVNTSELDNHSEVIEVGAWENQDEKSSWFRRIFKRFSCFVSITMLCSSTLCGQILLI